MSRGGGRDLGRRRRVAVQVPLGHPHAADVDRPGRLDVGRCRARTRSSRRRGRPRGRGRRRRAARSSPVAPRERQLRLLVPGDHLGRDADAANAVAHPATNSPRVARRRGRPRWPRTGPRSTPELLALLGVLAGHRRGCAPAPPGRSRRCGRRPGRAGRSPSGAPRRSASPVAPGPRRRPAGGSSWCRSRWRRPGSRRGPRPSGLGARRASAASGTQDPAGPPVAAAARAPRRRAG